MNGRNSLYSFACLIAALAVLAALCTGCDPAGNLISGDSTFGSIDTWIQSEMQSQHIPGLAVGIVKGSQTVYLKGFGIADPSGRAVTPQTPFVLASVSKSITALAVMQLVEAGSVELDAPAVKYLPMFKTADSAASGSITVRQLLNQTSGLSTYTGHLLNYRNGGKPLDDLVRELGGAGLASRQGLAFHYSNANFVLLADIVEHVTGRTYGDYVRDNIFVPLGMANSSVERTAEITGKMAAGYRPLFGFPVLLAPYDNVACLNNISTAEDMTHYLGAIMNDGSYLGASVCQPASIGLMQKPVAEMRAGVNYAMGFEVDTTKPYTVIMHPGDAPGFNANIAIMPKDGWGIVVLENINWLGMEGETGGVIAGIEQILDGHNPSIQPFNSGNIRIMFDLIYMATLFFLVRAFILLGRWKGRIDKDERKRLRRRLIPVLINNFSVPAGMLAFLPMAFSANWAIGFLNAPDFSSMMLAIPVLLLALGIIKTIIIIRRMLFLSQS